jgi:ABC-2 type transport system permease protein|uniref:Transport permease protein n=1 Tax=candidate division WOR-3 bacterium TaxID=2052148 RepID=A0A7V5XZD3_UNCW3
MFLKYLKAIWAENVKEWKIELSYKADFLRTFIDPIVYLLPYLLYGQAIVGGRFSRQLEKLTGISDIISFILLGYIFIGFMNMALWAMGFSLRKEQYYGTLEHVFATPVPRWVFTLGMALHSTLHQTLILLFQIIFINLIFRLYFNISGILPSLIAIALMLLSLYGFGMMVAGLTLTLKQGWLVSEALSGIMMVITPIAYPLAILPIFLRKLSYFVPTTYGIIATRHFLLKENLNLPLSIIYFRLFLLTIIWILFGLTIFYLIDKRVRKSGTLHTY